MPTERLSTATFLLRPVTFKPKGIPTQTEEVLGIKPAGGRTRNWPEFYAGSKNAAYRGGVHEQKLRWPAALLGRLLAFCDEVYMTPEYRAWCESERTEADVPFPRRGWNCYGFVARVATGYPQQLRPNRYALPMPVSLRLGDPVIAAAAENGRPYYLGRPNNPQDGHAVIAVQEAGTALNVFGGRQPLSWIRIDEAAKRHSGGIYPYLPK